MTQIQSELAYGHLGIVDAYEVLLTPSYVAIVLEYCADGTLLQYLDERVAYAQTVGLYMSEAEARFFFWVRRSMQDEHLTACAHDRAGWQQTPWCY